MSQLRRRDLSSADRGRLHPGLTQSQRVGRGAKRFFRSEDIVHRSEKSNEEMGVRAIMSFFFLLLASYLIFSFSEGLGASVSGGDITFLILNFGPDCSGVLGPGHAIAIGIMALFCMALSLLEVDIAIGSPARFVWGTAYFCLSVLLINSQFIAFRESSGCSSEISILTKLLVALLSIVCIILTAALLESRISPLIFFVGASVLIVNVAESMRLEELRLAGYFLQVFYVLAMMSVILAKLQNISLRNELMALFCSEKV